MINFHLKKTMFNFLQILRINNLKFDFIHFFKILLFELIYIYLMQVLYAIFSMSVFGEGANSFMYSNSNNMIFTFMVFGPETIVNIYKIFKNGNEKKLVKLKSYIVTQVIIIIFLIQFIMINI